MARSGTSLVAAMLKRLGFYLGPEDEMIVGDSDNPGGYHELAPFTDVNDRIRLALGMFANPALCVPADWRDFEGMPDLVETLKGRIDTTFRSHPGWLLKDPRISLLLPIYESIVPNPAFAICVRNPLDCAKSFNKKFEVPERVCIGMWLQHTLCALHDTKGAPRRVVLYESLLSDPSQQLGRILELYPHRWQSEEDLASAAGFVRADLNHEGKNQHLLGNLRPSLIRETFRVCQRGCLDPNLLNSGGLDREIEDLYCEFEAWWSINPSQIVFSTPFKVTWESNGKKFVESKTYVPEAKPNKLAFRLSAPEGTPVFCSFSHLPGTFVIREIIAVVEGGSVLPVDIQRSPDINMQASENGSTWWVPRDGNHFMFRWPKGAHELRITFSSLISATEMGHVASRSYRELIAEKQRNLRVTR
jgi:hypothetical protein